MGLQLIGRVISIWRYPVRSIGGEALISAHLVGTGIQRDREFALIDALDGKTAKPEREQRWHKALFLRATLETNLYPTIHFPDGNSIHVLNPQTTDVLTDYFGFPVKIAAYDTVEGFAEFISSQHRERHAPVHLVTTASLQHLASLRGVSTVDYMRFRPTFLIETALSNSFAEDEWIGQILKIGSAQLVANDKTKRCAFVFLPQPGITEDKDLLRTIVKNNQRSFGIYCSVQSSGEINLGDSLEVAS